ncbi:MAG: RNA polymerase sigma factor [Candidatus Pacebacteria bacterium]|nr:RNA polymerase sigma factor [Candidatus Paceibacterota bacterium]
MSSEKQLIVRLKRGQSSAVRQWFTLYHDRMLRYVRNKVGDPQDGEELVQETFLNALRQLPLFRGDASLWTWMIAIARHEIADYYRKRYAKKALHTVPLLDALLTKPLDDTSEISQLVTTCLARMQAHSAELLRLKYIDKKRVTEIAGVFGKTVKAIESELFRAREEFRIVYSQVLVESMM